MVKYIPFPFFCDDVPIDISFVFENEKPAGKHGFIKTNGRDLEFEDGTKVKFWGTNLNGAGCFPEHDYAEKFAKRLSKIGLNLVRFHQLDAEWHTPNIFSFTKGKRVTDAKLDPESMDRLDYLIYCLKKEGIYCYMDMFTYRKFRSDEGVENAKALKDKAKPACLFSDKLIELQKDLCRRLWTHVNPYTELAYCDDPVFVMAEIVNETDMFRKNVYPIVEPYNSEFNAKFDKWLLENNYSKKAEDFDVAALEDETVIDFLTYIQEEYYKEMYSYMHECGVKIPITGTNWKSFPANSKSQLVTDFFDAHPYYYDWKWGEFEKRCMNKSITQSEASYLSGNIAMTEKNKPTYISEWDMPWPNEYRAESPLYTAAIGMLQGWSGFAIHTYSYTAKLQNMNMLGSEIVAEKVGNTPYRQGIFSTWNDPAKFGLFYHAALITRRGDVKTSKNLMEIAPLSRGKWNGSSVVENIERTGIVSDLSFETFSEEAETKVPDEILSDTGELYINRNKNFGYINTPKTKCAYGFLGKNGNIELSGVNINCETDFAVIAMSSLTDEDISSSSNILLTTVGRAENTDFEFKNGLMYNYGKPPVRVEVIKADIEIQTDTDGLVVWAISPEGFYIGTVSTEYEDGKLKFTVGETSQSMYYLIVKE